MRTPFIDFFGLIEASRRFSRFRVLSGRKCCYQYIDSFFGGTLFSALWAKSKEFSYYFLS